MNHTKLFVLSIGCLGLLASAIRPVSAMSPEVKTSSAQEQAKPEQRNTKVFEDCLNPHIFWVKENDFLRNMVNAYHANKSYEEIKKTIKDNQLFQSVPELYQVVTISSLEKVLKECFEKASK